MTALPVGIVPFDTGHISHHNTMHAMLNDVDAPFGIAPIVSDGFVSLPAAGQKGRLYYDETYGRLLIDDGSDWQPSDSLVVSVLNPGFGVTGDGATNDQPAIQAVIDLVAALGGGVVWFPVPTNFYRLTGAPLSLLGSNGVTLAGASMNLCIIEQQTAGQNVIELDGYHQRVTRLRLSGFGKTATTGLMVHGYSAATTQYQPVRKLHVSDVLVQDCLEGFRLGHYSTLNAVAGDGGDADITGNSFVNIWADSCDYGFIQDGQNILENHILNLITSEITYNHVVCPRGGYPHIDTWDAGNTLTAGYAKVDLQGSGHCVVKRCRSENNLAVPFIQTPAGSSTSQVLLEQCELTCVAGDPTEVNCNYRGGAITHIGVNADGKINLVNTDFVAINSTALGGYNKTGNQNTKLNFIVDRNLTSGKRVQVPELYMTGANPAGITFNRDGVGAASEYNLFTAQDSTLGTPLLASFKALIVLATTKNTCFMAGNYIDGLFVQSQWGFADAIPTTGAWTRGTILFNRTCASGQPAYWMCTVSGTPGTWKAGPNLP